jgi:hypothetical protein
MTGAMADLMVGAEEIAGTIGGTTVDGIVVVPDGIAIDLIGGIITVIGALTGASSGKLLHRKAVRYGSSTAPLFNLLNLDGQ